MPTTISFDDLPDGLLLKLGKSNSEAYEVECERCKGTGIITGDPITSLTMRARCPDCNGTGKVRKRVEGAVEIGLFIGITEENNPIIIASVRWWKDEKGSLEWYWEYGKDKDGELIWDKIIPDLIAAYRANTLPDAVKAHLKEVDAE